MKKNIAFRFLIPRKGTETYPSPLILFIHSLSDFWFPERGLKQEKKETGCSAARLAFRFLIPRKGTETKDNPIRCSAEVRLSDFWFPERGLKQLDELVNEVYQHFPIFDSPKGDWNNSQRRRHGMFSGFPIFDSPKGDWNRRLKHVWLCVKATFRFLIPRKGTETLGVLLEEGSEFTFRFLIPRKGTETKTTKTDSPMS